MARKDDIRRFTAVDLAERRAREESRTDPSRLREAHTDEIERLAREQLIEDGIPLDWYETAQAVMPQTKKLVLLRLDSDVLELKSYIRHMPAKSD